jgi:hypothetical protein
MSDSSFRSRYAGMPGSLVAIRVDYARRSAAFDSLPPDTDVSQSKRDVKRWKMGHRLGDKAEWNNSAQPEGYTGSAPQRPNLRQLSEYQGIRLEYNYRASKLPDINHTTRFVPQPSKLQVDRSIFLPDIEKQKLVDRNQGTATLLSRREMTNEGVPGAEREYGWNISSALAEERTNIYKLRGYEDFRDINKTKSVLDHGTYVPPQRRQVAAMKTSREVKITKREDEARQRAAREAARYHPHSASANSSTQGAQRSFKMSNIDDWWDNDFDSKIVAAASTVLGKPVRVQGVAPASTHAALAAGGEGHGDNEVNDP